MKLNTLKNFLSRQGRLIEELGAIKGQNRKLTEEIFRLQRELRDPRSVVEAIMRQGIEWFNYEELPYADRVQYFNDAQTIIRNKTFQNEVKCLFKELIDHLATQSKDFPEVRDLRATMNGIDLLRKRFSEIKNPEKTVSKQSIHEAI